MNLLDKIKSLELSLLEMSRDDDARHFDRVKMAVELSLLYDKDRDERKPTKNEVSGKELKKREDFLDKIVGNMGLGFRRFKYIFDHLPEKKDWIGMNYEKTYERLLHEAEQDKLRKQAEQREHARKLREEKAEKERKEAEAAAAEKAKQDRLERERIQRELEEAAKAREKLQKAEAIIQAAPLVQIKKAEVLAKKIEEKAGEVVQQAVKKAVERAAVQAEEKVVEVRRESEKAIKAATQKAQRAETLVERLTRERDEAREQLRLALIEIDRLKQELASERRKHTSPAANGRHHNTRRMNGRVGASGRSGRMAKK